jgi:hypothetical protein
MHCDNFNCVGGTLELREILFSIFLLFAIAAKADDGIMLNFSVLPDQFVKTTINSSSDFVIEAKGDDQITAKMKERGASFPIRVKQFQTQNFSIKSGQVDSEGSFPFVRTLNESNSYAENTKGQRINLPDNMSKFVGLSIEGKINRDGVISVDNVTGIELDPKLKKMFFSIGPQLANVEIAPKQRIKIGDTFTVDSPMNIPLPGYQPIQIVLHSHYFLKRIEEDRAFFDETTDFTMSSNQSDGSLNASGGGSGIMIYNVKSRLREKRDSAFHMKADVTIGALVISSKIESSTSLDQYLISPDDDDTNGKRNSNGLRLDVSPNS